MSTRKKSVLYLEYYVQNMLLTMVLLDSFAGEMVYFKNKKRIGEK